MSQDGARKTAGLSGLDHSGPHYGRDPETKEGEIGSISVPDRTSSRLADLVGHEQLAGAKYLFRALLPVRSLFRSAVKVQGDKAIAEGAADPEVAAVDKSLIAARGPLWHKCDRQRNRIPKGLQGVDRESTWGYSQHDAWVQGYSFEVVVSATSGSTVFPLAATVDTASAKETQTFADKVEELPEATDYVLADSGYDSNELGERIEYGEQDQRTGRRFLCPENRRGSKQPTTDQAPTPRDESHRRRLARRKFLKSRKGKRLYARRGQTVEPFNDWFKTLFELDHRVWHRGLDNNRTQILAAIFAYQLLVRYNHRRGNENGQVKWLVDGL